MRTLHRSFASSRGSAALFLARVWAIASLLVITLASAAGASGIYFTTTGSAFIGRANLDGTGSVPHFIPSTFGNPGRTVSRRMPIMCIGVTMVAFATSVRERSIVLESSARMPTEAMLIPTW